MPALAVPAEVTFACCKGVVTWAAQLLQHRTLQHHKVNVHL